MISICRGPSKSDIQGLLLFIILIQIGISLLSYWLYKKNIFNLKTQGWRLFVGLLFFILLSSVPMLLISIGTSILLT